MHAGFLETRARGLSPQREHSPSTSSDRIPSGGTCPQPYASLMSSRCTPHNGGAGRTLELYLGTPTARASASTSTRSRRGTGLAMGRISWTAQVSRWRSASTLLWSPVPSHVQQSVICATRVQSVGRRCTCGSLCTLCFCRGRPRGRSASMQRGRCFDARLRWDCSHRSRQSTASTRMDLVLEQ